MPISLLIEIAAASVMGCAVGWITNAVAIDMLFKKYLRWGGVIEENYEAFIKNMSQLVEDDLVNGRTLQREFAAEGFRTVLRKWVGDIIKKELPENSGKTRLEAVPGAADSVNNVISLMEKIQSAPLDGICKIISDEKISALVSQEQYNYFINTNIKNIFAAKDGYEHKIKNALAVFVRDKPLNALVSGGAIRLIAQNAGTVIQKTSFSQYESDLDRGYQELLIALGSDALIKKLQDDLGGMRFSSFVKDSEKLSRELIKRVVEFAGSNEGRKAVSEIVAGFLRDARKIDLKLDQIAGPRVKDSIILFCEQKMPGIIDRICFFIDNTRPEIEKIVNDTVDRQLDSNLWGKFLKVIKDVFIENLAGKKNVISKIIEAMRQYGGEAGSGLSEQIIKLLETRTLGEIAAAAEDAGIIDVPSIVELINRNLRELENKEFHFIDKLLEFRISDIFGALDISIIKTALLPMIFDRLKRDYLYGDRFKRDVNALLSDKAAEFADKNISDFFDVYKIKIPLNHEKIRDGLLGLWNSASETRMHEVLGKNPRIPPVKRGTFEDLWEKKKETELNRLYEKIQGDAVYAKISDGIIDILNQNLDALLTGSVSSLVNSELSKLRPKEINSMVRDFMGREMKAINILGALLGLVIGGLFAAGAYLAGVPDNFLWRMLAAYGVIFALVGIGTNWLAIKMLFKPYHALVPGLKVPPFIGIVPARKSEFAKNLGAFVKERMLGDGALANFFTANRDTVKDVCFTKLRGGNYAVIDKVLSDTERLESLSEGIYSAVQSYITSRRAEISSAAADITRRYMEAGKLHGLIPALRDGIVSKLKESGAASVLANFIKKETEGKRLGAYGKAVSGFADTGLKTLFKAAAQDLTRKLTLEKIKKLIAEQNGRFTAYIECHSLLDTVGSEVTDNIAGKAAQQAGPLLKSGIMLGILPGMMPMVKEEFNPDKKLNEIFGGAFSRLLSRNTGFVIDMISREIGGQREALINSIRDGMNPVVRLAAGKQIPAIVDALLDQELPAFLHRKQRQLEEIAGELLEYRLSDIGVTHETLKTETIQHAIASILESPHVQLGVSNFAGALIKQASGLPLKTLLDITGIKDLNGLIQTLEPLLSTSADHLRDSMSGDEVIGVIVKLAKDILMKLFEPVTTEELFCNIDLEKELRVLFTKLIADENVMREIAGIAEDALCAVEKDPAFYNGELLQKDMENYILHFGVEQGWERLRNAALPALKEFLTHINPALTMETKDAICGEYLLTAIIDSAAYNFSDLIRSIDVRSVVEREINNMHPRGIEKLFYKFAGDYFRKIIFYGWIGLFGGLLSYAVGYALVRILRK